MASIFPDVAAGGVTVRDGNGVCQNPANVSHAYCPPADFNVTCIPTALPNDCTARITGAQINAIVSEMLSFAVCLDPEGSWNCASVQNLCSAFTNWFDSNRAHADQNTIIGAGTEEDPFMTNPVNVAQQMCNSLPALQTLRPCLLSTDSTQLMTLGSDGRILIRAGDIVGALCADPDGDNLANCLRSTDAGNGLGIGTDGRLLVNANTLPNATDTVGGVVQLAVGTNWPANANANNDQDATTPLYVKNATAPRIALMQANAGNQVLLPGVVTEVSLPVQSQVGSVFGNFVGNTLVITVAGTYIIAPYATVIAEGFTGAGNQASAFLNLVVNGSGMRVGTSLGYGLAGEPHPGLTVNSGQSSRIVQLNIGDVVSLTASVAQCDSGMISNGTQPATLSIAKLGS